jgi:putative membrane protein
MQPVPFTLHNAFTHWDTSVFPVAMLVLCAAIAAWYLSAEWKLALRGRRWPVSRTISFCAGLLVAWLAFASPVATLAMSYFQAHVIQHLTLMVLAPPLLALGAPSTLFLQTARRPNKQRWLRVLRSTPFAVLTHPVTVWCLYFGVMFVFFLTPLINVAMHHMVLMDCLNLVFLAGGTLYWWPMVGIDPIVHWKMTHGMRLLNLLIGSGIEAFLGVAILASARPEASMYTLASTRSGGALLWVTTEVSTLGGFLPIFIQWVRSEARAGAREDLRAAARAAQLEPVTAADLAARDAAKAALANGNGARPLRHQPQSAWEAAWLTKVGSLPGGTVANPPPHVSSP